jgi:GAF domain-containing protein
MNAAERQRLEALRRYGLLDSERETVFDRIAFIAALLLDAPIAIVGFLDETRHWFKSAVGTNTKENARAASFCTRTIQEAGLLEVRDACADERFNHLPVVTQDGIRAYAGAPLITWDAQRIGTVCVFHRAPRPKLLEVEKTLLTNLASLTMRALEARLEQEPFSDSYEALLNGLDLHWQPLFGRGEESLTLPRAVGNSSEERLMARIRAAPSAPILARVARLPRERALILHSFGDAAPERTWAAWTVTRGAGPQVLTTFTAPLAALDIPEDAALLLLSNEPIGIPSSQPQEILASGSVEKSTGTSLS